jgi:spermidine synthase
MIDGSAGTPMARFTGNLEQLRYLAYDMSAVGHHLRAPRSALVIGAGGGRDILTARMFGIERIHAVEVNPLIAGFVRGPFRSYSGSPYDLPGVSFSVEDGRGFAARSDRSFDLIQLSAVDTTAALSAGALSLVEDSLYTVEAFEDYYDHLTAQGILTVTRNWTQESHPMALRSADLVRAAWSRRGHERPEDHLVLVAPAHGAKQRWGTLLASRSPFTSDDLARLRAIVAERGFTILYAPGAPGNPAVFRELLGSKRERARLLRQYPYDVRATSDDRPFFFFFLKPLGIGVDASQYAGTAELFWDSRKTPRILLLLFGLVTALVTVFTFAIPIVVGRLRLSQARGAGVGLLYFAGIGLGFILVELALIQRYTLLLGQPVFAFAAILGCILIASGLGSYLTGRVGATALRRLMPAALAAVIFGVALHAILGPELLAAAMQLGLKGRLGVTIATLVPLGLVMGMPMPLGIRWLAQRAPNALAWAWGVNGSLSVMGTVLAMVLSIFFGITATMLCGAAAYGASLLCARR